MDSCTSGRYDPARLDLRCDTEVRSENPPQSADLARWRPPESMTMQVERARGRYRVRLEGALACRFTTGAADAQAFEIPRGTRCTRAGRSLRVEAGYVRGAGGLVAPTHAELFAVLAEGAGAVRVVARLHAPTSR